jgi:hypothetical protein
MRYVLLLILVAVLAACEPVWNETSFVTAHGVRVNTDVAWLSEEAATNAELEAAAWLEAETGILASVFLASLSAKPTIVQVMDSPTVACPTHGGPDHQVSGCTLQNQDKAIVFVGSRGNCQQQWSVYQHEITHVMLYRVTGNADVKHTRAIWALIDAEKGC